MSQISNQGTIVKLKKQKVIVKIEAKSACGHCNIKDSCYIQTCQNKVIEIRTNQASNYKIGETVNVFIDESSAWKAIFCAYILPLILVLTTIITGICWGTDEIVSAIYGILILIPYYLILYISKTYIRDKIKFGIEKIQ